MPKTASRIVTDIDFAKPGVQTGTLQIPYSHDRDAYGHVPVPLMVAANGAGPTVLLTGANHGDEVEGSVALWRTWKRATSSPTSPTRKRRPESAAAIGTSPARATEARLSAIRARASPGWR